jgi:hypothetical protein
MLNAIGPFAFRLLEGHPVPPKLSVVKQQRPGTTGAVRSLQGVHAEGFKLRSESGWANLWAAEAAYLQYVAAIGMWFPLLQHGIVQLDGLLVFVDDVVRERCWAPILDTDGFGALLECTWSLEVFF